MSKLEELIQQYCPDGVEYKNLGDVMSIQRGASPRPIQNYITNDESGIPWIKIGDVTPESKYIKTSKGSDLVIRNRVGPAFFSA